MKKDPVIFLLIVVVIMCIATAAKILAMHLSHEKNDPESEYFVTTGDDIIDDTVAISEFDELDLDVSSINTYIQTGDSFKLEYHAFEYNIPEVEQNGKSLTVKQPSHTGIFNLHIKNEEQYYRITVPKSAGMLDVDLDASSGKINIEGISLEGKANLSSGNFILNNSEGDDFDLRISSGNANLENVKFESLKLDLSSGNLNVQGCTSNELEAKMSSGNMNLSGMGFKEGDFKSSSGNLKLEVVGNKDDFSYDLKASTGSVVLDGERIDKKYRSEVEKDRSIKADITSGKIEISFTK
ncbi:MAG: DUF4097 family beta strand repeat protein [Butyrivibrio sp.]|nr:DUF4097 family beta strand repeat protein [Butyrivibrio sp.]